MVVLFAVIAGLFGLMAAFGIWSPKLGLDLRGGTTITLTASNTTGGGSVDPNSLEQARDIIEQRVNGLGVGESEVTTANGNQIIVSVPNVQQDELVRLVGQTAVLSFRAVYDVAAVQPPLEPTPAPSGEPSTDPSAAPSGEPSASAEPGDPSAVPSPTGDGRPPVQLPTAPPTPRPTEPGSGTPPAEAINWQPSERDQADFAAFTCDQQMPEVSDQPLIACDQTGTQKFLLGPTLVDGDKLADASAGIPQNQFSWVVNLEFDAEGAELFENATGELAQRTDPQNRFAIVLDARSISAPSVDSAIPGGRAQIEGGFDQETANQLANVLRYGALPLAFEVSSVDNVSATLGGEQLEAGFIAGAIGLALVVGFCLLAYRGLGLVVIGSLVVAAALTYALLVLLGESVGMALNLPGIAGAIVAIGMTADSFVIYFERIRDEMRDGRSLRSAVEVGWHATKRTILIADAVQLLSAVVLFALAVGSVKGFAFTLGLTTLIDIVVVFYFTKPLMSLLARTRFFTSGRRWSGLDPEHIGVRGSRPRRRPLTPAKALAERVVESASGRTARPAEEA
nr:protein translocase subunit SecD [Auraticoccus cholistanensis]